MRHGGGLEESIESLTSAINALQSRVDQLETRLSGIRFYTNYTDLGFSSVPTAFQTHAAMPDRSVFLGDSSQVSDAPNGSGSILILRTTRCRTAFFDFMKDGGKDYRAFTAANCDATLPWKTITWTRLFPLVLFFLGGGSFAMLK